MNSYYKYICHIVGTVSQSNKSVHFSLLFSRHYKLRLRVPSLFSTLCLLDMLLTVRVRPCHFKHIDA